MLPFPLRTASTTITIASIATTDSLDVYIAKQHTTRFQRLAKHSIIIEKCAECDFSCVEVNRWNAGAGEFDLNPNDIPVCVLRFQLLQTFA